MKAQRETPSLAEIDYNEAAKYCVQAALATAPATAVAGATPWQFREGFQAYKMGKPLRSGMADCFYPDSRAMWRLGWMAAMFRDLQNRERIHTHPEVSEG